MSKFYKTFYAAITIIFAFLMGDLAYATGPDYTSLTAAVDFSGVITAILAVAALLAAVYVVRKGIRLVLGSLR